MLMETVAHDSALIHRQSMGKNFLGSKFNLINYSTVFLSFVICLCIQAGLDNMLSISQVGARQAV